jgi:opacity protein-like surface antigen
MNKHILSGLVAVAALPLSIQAYAGVAPVTMMPPPAQTQAAPEASPFNGVYVGVGAGLASMHAKTEHSFPLVLSHTNDIRNNWDWTLFSGNTDRSIGDQNFGADAFLGYGHVFNQHYYLGGEIFGTFTNLDAKGNDSNLNLLPGILDSVNVKYSDVETKYSFGGDIRLGYLFTPRTLAYVLVGADYGNFEVTPLEISGFGHIDGKYGKFNKHELGLMPGLGIETMITDHLSLRAQYTYSMYQKFSHTDTLIDQDILDWLYPLNINLKNKSKVNLNRGLFTLNLSYIF